MEQLFESYYEISKDTDLKKNEKVFICEFVPKLKEDDLEALYILIYQYYMNEGNEANTAYPYNSKKNKLRGIDFNLTKIPYKLRNMIFKFCKAIESKCEDEQVSLTIDLKKKKKK